MKAASSSKVARVYLRVSTGEQDLARQADIEHAARADGYYIAGVYREKASGARANRPELLRMIADLQPGDVVVAERIDRISRLPLPEAERLVASIKAKGALGWRCQVWSTCANLPPKTPGSRRSRWKPCKTFY